MAYPGLTQAEHQYLGKDYCTGYTDIFGKWNTGFYCPQYGYDITVFCCGNDAFKYCCTDQTPVDVPSPDSAFVNGDDPNFGDDGEPSTVFVRVPIVFGFVCGIAAVLILLVVAACYFCSCCVAYKKRRFDVPNRLQGGFYQTSNSTTSNLLNLYSPSGTNVGAPNSTITSPVDLDWTFHPHSTSGSSSISSTYHFQPQYQVPALTSTVSQRVSHNSSPSSLLYNSNCVQNRLQPTESATIPAAAYYNINSSSSTLSSRRQTPTTQHPQLISGATNIVGSYFGSLQRQSRNTQTHDAQTADLQPPPPYEGTRHQSPPPTYFQTVSSYGNGANIRNALNASHTSTTNNNTNRARITTIQSALGSNSNSLPRHSINGDDITDFILRHENTLRRTLSMRISNNNARNNDRSSRGNSMLTQRELLELLLRLTNNQAPTSLSTGSSTVSRSESRAGSDSTTRSTASSEKVGANVTPSSLQSGTCSSHKNPSNSKLTISELDEDDLTQIKEYGVISKTSNADSKLISTSRIADKDSGVPSSTCSSTGSEASAVIDSTEEVVRLKSKKQHNVLNDEDRNQNHPFTASHNLGADKID